MCFRRQTLPKMWPIELAFHHFILRTMFLSALTPYNISSVFILRAQMLSSILLQQDILKLAEYSNLLSEVSKFQQYKTLRSKCSIPLVS
jgi:hypothetical protein